MRLSNRGDRGLIARRSLSKFMEVKMNRIIMRVLVAAMALALFPLIAAGPLAAPAPDQAKMEKGEKIFSTYCVTCHQKTGEGMPGVFPPLAKSDYLVNNDKNTIISSVVNGLNEPTVINGVKYTTPMPPIPPNYTDEDVAAVITYVLNTWGNPGGEVTAEEVKAARK